VSAEVRLAVWWAWRISAAAGLAALLAPLVLPDPLLYGWFGSCPGCPLCGMTHAFAYLARGQWTEAARANSGGVPLFAALALNGLAAIFSFGREIRCRLSD
jgi:hypothetical protein